MVLLCLSKLYRSARTLPSTHDQAERTSVQYCSAILISVATRAWIKGTLAMVSEEYRSTPNKSPNPGSSQSVFLSHTSELAEYPSGRSFIQAAVDAVNTAGMVPVYMSQFAAGDDVPADHSCSKVRNSDVFVAIVGFRYGSLVSSRDISYIELEFDEATTAERPRLVFLLDESAPIPPTLLDENRDAINAFRSRLRAAGLIVKTFHTASDLELRIFQALCESGCTSRARPDQEGIFPPVFMHLLTAQIRAANYLSYQTNSRTNSMVQLYVEQRLEPSSYSNLQEALACDPDDLQKLLDDVYESEWHDPYLELSEVSLQGTPDKAQPADSTLPIERSMQRLARDQEYKFKQHVLLNYAPRPTASRLMKACTNQHALILADAGIGKTTMTLQLVRQVAQSLLNASQDNLADQETRIIALRVTAAHLCRQAGSWKTSLVRAAGLELGQYLDSDLPDNLLDLLPPSTRLLVLVDGLDEITEPSLRTKLFKILKERVEEKAVDVRIFLTSRPLPDRDFQSLSGRYLDTYNLQAFSPSEFSTFTKHWFGRGPAEEVPLGFIEEVQESRLDGIVENPLFATLAAGAYVEDGTRSLPARHFDLIERLIVQLVMARSEESDKQWANLVRRFAALPATSFSAPLERLRAERVEILRAVAYLQGKDPSASLVKTAIKWIFENISPTIHGALQDWPYFVVIALSETGLVRPTGADFAFIHSTIANHLEASFRSRMLPTEFDPSDQVWNSILTGDFISTLIHYGRQCSNSNELLNWLQAKRQNAAIFAGELMAEGFPFDDENVQRFLVNMRSVINSDSRSEMNPIWWEIAARLGHRDSDELLRSTVRASSSYSRPAMEAMLKFSRKEATRMLVEMSMSGLVVARERVIYAALLVGLGKRYQSQISKVLKKIICDESVEARSVRGLVQLYGELGERYAKQAAEMLVTMSQCRQLESVEMIHLANVLARLPVEKRFFEIAVELLQSIGSDVAEIGKVRLYACSSLLKVDSTSQRLISDVFQELIDDQSTTDLLRMQVK